MVVTGEPEQSPPRQRVSALGVVSGVGVAILALAVLGNLTRVDPPEEAPLTTIALNRPTTTAMFTEQGDPLEFEVVLSRQGQAPLGVVENGGLHYLFVSAGSDGQGSYVGLETLVSHDGVTWESVGTGIAPPTRVGSVIGIEDGFLAFGYWPHRDALEVWMSGDGVQWEPIAVPLEPGETANISGGIDTGDRLLIYGNVGSFSDDAWATISQALLETYGVDAYNFDYNLMGNGAYSVTLWGPLGLTLAQTTNEELGISTEELIQTPGPSTFTVWSKTGGGEWERSVIEQLSHIQSTYTAPDGRIMLLGYTDSGFPALLGSGDGTTWEVADRMRSDLNHLQRAGGRWIASSSSGPEVLVSLDLADWNPTGVGTLFGDSRPWWISQMTGDDRWTAAVVTSVTDSTYLPPEPLETERSGYLLRIDDYSVSIREPDSGKVVLRLPRWTSGTGNLVEPGVVFDRDTAMVDFVDPATGEVLITLSLDELQAIEAEWSGSRPQAGDQMNVLVLSDDTFVWTSQGIDLGLDGYSYPMFLHLTDDQLLVLVAWYDPANQGRFGFDVHTARLPADR